MISTILLATQLSYGQQRIDQLFETFRGEERVTSFRLGGFWMGLTGLFTDTFGVKNLEIMELDECDPAVKERFSTAVHDLEDPDYETVVISNEKGSRMEVLVKFGRDEIRELVCLVTGADNLLISMKGKIKSSDVGSLIGECKCEF